MSRRKATPASFTFDIGEKPSLHPPVLQIASNKRWIIECSLDKHNWIRLQTGSKSEFFDLIPKVRFYRVRRYGRYWAKDWLVAKAGYISEENT